MLQIPEGHPRNWSRTQQRALAVATAIEELPDEERDVVMSRGLLHLSLAETAKSLQMTTGSVAGYYRGRLEGAMENRWRNMPMDPNGDLEERLDDAVAEYLEAEDGGKPLETTDFLGRHPDLQSELKDFLANHAGASEDLAPLDQGAQTRPRHTSERDSISDYDIGAEIDRGGMGVIYHAWQRSLQRKVAIKGLASRS